MVISKSKLFEDKYMIGGGIVSIMLYMLPYIILGENAYITIHDFLDQNVVIMSTLKNTGLFVSIDGVVPNMNGLDRSLFPFFSPFDVKMLCYMALPTYWAIITYTLVYKVVAFLGMYLLLNTYFLQGKNKGISFLLSLGFALVPFYIELALSGAGFPLMVYAFLNLYNNRNKLWSYIAIIFYSFNSLLAYGGFFFLAVLFCFIIYDFSQTKKISKNILFGAILMGGIYLIANLGTFYSLFFSESFVSHRSEWVHSTSLTTDLRNFVNLILYSQYHAGNIFAAPILLLYIYSLIKYRKKYHILTKVALLYILIVVGIFIGMLLKCIHVQLFVSVQFDRFYFFYPSVVIMLLAAVCYVFIQERKHVFVCVLAVLGVFSGIAFDKEMINNGKLLVNKDIYQPTFSQFYDTKLFEAIHSDLNTSPDYITKVVSVGMYPAVAEYNGFYTLDSYRVNYPLDYKHKFREVIAPELEKDEILSNYFDGWGSRCYLFSADCGKRYMYGKNDRKQITLDINVEKLRGLGCEYIFSAVDITNYDDLGFDYVNTYSNKDSYWEIRVYKI